MRYIVLSLLIFFSVSAVLLLFQKPKTVEIVRDVLKVQQIEKLTEKIVTEVRIEELLLPDLAIEKPSQLFISGSGKNRKIKFNTIFSNKGDGPFEVIGHSDEQRKTTFATQYIKRKDGTGMYREIGNFVFHPEHRHWHVANHVQYELWNLNPDGSPAQIATNSGKMSICMFDDRPYDLKLPGAPQKKEYTFICNTRVQGVSVGWSDVYLARIEGQEIPLGNLADGEYLFHFSVNPDRKILEKDYTNNEGGIKIEIKASQLKIL